LDISYNEGQGPHVVLLAAIKEAIKAQVQLWSKEVAIHAEHERARQLELKQAASEEEEARLDVRTYCE
jgi:hypothetical protein